MEGDRFQVRERVCICVELSRDEVVQRCGNSGEICVKLCSHTFHTTPDTAIALFFAHHKTVVTICHLLAPRRLQPDHTANMAHEHSWQNPLCNAGCLKQPLLVPEVICLQRERASGTYQRRERERGGGGAQSLLVARGKADQGVRQSELACFPPEGAFDSLWLCRSRAEPRRGPPPLTRRVVTSAATPHWRPPC